MKLLIYRNPFSGSNRKEIHLAKKISYILILQTILVRILIHRTSKIEQMKIPNIKMYHLLGADQKKKEWALFRPTVTKFTREICDTAIWWHEFQFISNKVKMSTHNIVKSKAMCSGKKQHMMRSSKTNYPIMSKHVCHIIIQFHHKYKTTNCKSNKSSRILKHWNSVSSDKLNSANFTSQKQKIQVNKCQCPSTCFTEKIYFS